MRCTRPRCRRQRAPGHHWCRRCLAEDAARYRAERRLSQTCLRVPPDLRASAVRAARTEGLSLATWAREVALDSIGMLPVERRRLPVRDASARGNRISVPLLPEERAALDAAARKAGVTYGTLIHRAIRLALGWPLHDRARRFAPPSRSRRTTP